MTMAVLQFTVTDESGNVVPGAHVEIKGETPGQPLAAPKSNRAGTTPMDNPSDADADGFFQCFLVGGAYQVRVYTGASGAPTTEHIRRYVAVGLGAETDAISSGLTTRIVTDAGAVTIDADDADIIYINKTVGAATTVDLPASATRSKPVRIVDRKYDAATNNITIDAFGSETIMGGATYIIDSNGAGITLTPLPDGSGWS